MVSFVCDGCQDTVKKPKLDQHYSRCRSAFTCVDCSTMFQNYSWSNHSSCMSEAQKVQGKLYRGPKVLPPGSTAASAAAPVSEPSQQPNKKVETPKANQKKRSRTEDVEEEPVNTKKQKVAEEESKSTPSSEAYAHLKASRVLKKILKKADKKSLPVSEAKEKLLEQLRAQVEEDLIKLADEAIAKHDVTGDKVKLKKK